MKCSFCGNELEPGTGFCPSCGTLNSFDNNFERPKQTEEKPEPAPKKENDNDVYSEPITIREGASYQSFDNIGAVPEYVSPVFDGKEPPKEEAPTVEAEAEEEEPLMEMRPEEEIETEPETQTDTEKLDDMYIGSSKGKKKKIIIPILAILLVAVIVGGAYAAKNNLFKPEVSNSTDDSTNNIPVVVIPGESDTSESETEESSSSQEAPTEDTSETTESTSETTETTETTQSTVAEPSSEESTTQPTTAESTTKPETTNPSTTVPTTTRPATTKPATTRPATTKPTPTKPTPTKPTPTKPTPTKPTPTKPTPTKPTPTKPTPSKPTPAKPSTTTLQKPKKTVKQYTAYVNTNGVSLRYAPSKSAANRVSLSIGADVVVSGEENGYLYVYSNRYSISGWVSKTYISSKRPVAETEQKAKGLVEPDKTYSSPKTKYVSTADGLRLRKGPGTDYDIIRNIGKGYPVAVKGESASAPGWLYVTDITRGITGWVMGTYLN